MLSAGFFEKSISFRGTTRSILAYAEALQRFSKEYICTYYFLRSGNNHIPAAKLFLEKGIAIKAIENTEELRHQKLDFLYYVTSEPPGAIKWLKELANTTLLHQVGYQFPDHEASTHFAYTSHWQNLFFTDGNSHTLPYIIEDPSPIENRPLQKEARQISGIPQDAIVFGRHGGIDTWNLPFSSKAVFDAANSRHDIYFLFLNTPKFADHPQIKFLNGTHDNNEREVYLSACDAMLHSRWEGETFGLACAEFLIRRKPILTWSESRERNHFLMAENSVITFNHYNDLLLTLKTVDKKYLEHKATLIPDWISTRYSQENVAQNLIKLIS